MTRRHGANTYSLNSRIAGHVPRDNFDVVAGNARSAQNTKHVRGTYGFNSGLVKSVGTTRSGFDSSLC